MFERTIQQNNEKLKEAKVKIEVKTEEKRSLYLNLAEAEARIKYLTEEL
jgi:hypothetical protein